MKAGGPSVSAPPPPMDATSASLLGLIRPAPLAGPGGSGGGGGVRLYTEQDIVEGKAKGQQQRARFSHPAIPPPLIRVSFDFFSLLSESLYFTILLSTGTSMGTSVDPNSLNLDPDLEFLPNVNQYPWPSCLSLKKNKNSFGADLFSAIAGPNRWKIGYG